MANLSSLITLSRKWGRTLVTHSRWRHMKVSCSRAQSTKSIGVLTFALAVLALPGCDVGPGEEVTSKPYADAVGGRYRVVADNLYAYGVYGSDNKTLSYITLVPMGIGGSEFAFRRTVPKGQVLTILSAWRRLILFESGVYYLVAFENWDLPDGIPVRLELGRGNEGIRAEPNPAVYQKLTASNDEKP